MSYTLFYNNVFYNDFNQSLLSIGSNKANSTNGQFPVGLNCSCLWHQVSSKFDQSIWTGDRLIAEPNSLYGGCNCSQGCDNLLSSLTPTTLTSTSLQVSSSISPSSHSLSSVPTLTSTPTQFQTSFVSSSPVCFYQVPNCNLCPLQAPLFDLTQGSVSCVFFQSEWRWTFTPDSGSFTNTVSIIVTGNTTTLFQGNFENSAKLNISSGSTVFVQGNLTQSSGGQTVFTIDFRMCFNQWKYKFES